MPSYPASYAGVSSVCAVDMNGARAPYSNFGANVDVAAPGGNRSVDLNGDGYPDGVLSTGANDSTGARQVSYRFENGTSMACPHVAGVVALMKAVHPGLTPTGLDALLESGALADDLGAPGRDDQFGQGLINAFKAVQAALQAAGGAPATGLELSATALNFGVERAPMTLTVSRSGTGPLTGVAAAENAAWLNVAPAAVDADGLGTYTVTVNDAGLPDGLYTARITFASTTPGVGFAGVSVTMEVGAAAGGGDAGVHYVILLDAATGLGVPGQTVMTAAVNGTYAYAFSGVAPGSYFVFAGTDSDNDGFIGDSGEALGAYPTLNQAGAIIIANGDVRGVDFVSGFESEIGTASAGIRVHAPVKRVRP